jgi:hypothetical protein
MSWTASPNTSVKKETLYSCEESTEEKAEERIMRNLLAKMSLTVEQIADIAGVAVEFIENLKRKPSSLWAIAPFNHSIIHPLRFFQNLFQHLFSTFIIRI